MPEEGSHEREIVPSCAKPLMLCVLFQGCALASLLVVLGQWGMEVL